MPHYGADNACSIAHKYFCYESVLNIYLSSILDFEKQNFLLNLSYSSAGIYKQFDSIYSLKCRLKLSYSKNVIPKTDSYISLWVSDSKCE